MSAIRAENPIEKPIASEIMIQVERTERSLVHSDQRSDPKPGLVDETGTEIDAVFGLNDALALGAMHALHMRRVSVPDEVAVIGFDDIDEARYASPPMTSVSPGREEEGLYNMPGGQSGHPLSPFFLEGHAQWVRAEPVPLLPGAAKHTLRFVP